MVIRNLQKRFKTLLLFSMMLFACSAYAENMQKLPVIRNVAIVPPQFFSHQEKDLFPYKQETTMYFREEVRASGKYSVLSKEIAEDLWDTYQERQFIKSQYDLDAWLSLLVAKEKDRVVMTVRMLDPDFVVWAQDSVTISGREWIALESGERRDLIRQVLYSLFNKWPIDAYITSIHQPFLTLSGGYKQGVRLGDRLKLYRVVVTERHPATGVFYKFDESFLGYAQIVDLQKTTAVAKISDLVSYQPLSIGDGVRVENSRMRQYFESQVSYHVVDDSALVAMNFEQPDVELMPVEEKLEEEVGVEVEKDQKKPHAIAKIEKEENIQSSSSAPKAQSPQKESSSAGLFALDLLDVIDDDDTPGPANGYMSYFADNMTIYTGYHHWAYHGSVKASGQFVSPLNQVGVSITRGILDHMKYSFDVSGGFSKTSASGPLNTTSLSSLAKIFWHQKMQNPVWFEKWFAGAIGGFQFLSVQDTQFGGYDNVIGGFFGGLQGSLREKGKTIANWTLEGNLTPLHIGRIGYENKLHSIQSALDVELGFHLSWLNSQPRTIDWGLGFVYGQTQFVSPGSSSQTSQQSRLSRAHFLITARWDYDTAQL